MQGLTSEEVQALKDFEVGGELGRGQFGSVRLVFDRQRLQRFAMKIVKSDAGRGVPPSVLKEVGILRDIEHENVVRIEDVMFFDTMICILYELASSDLHKLLVARAKAPLPAERQRALGRQLFAGLAELHAQRVLHRDIKPANLLLFEQGGREELKIADFGISRVATVPLKQQASDVVTLWYRAPELLLGASDYDEKVDVWSAGCVLLELWLRRPPFAAKDAAGQLDAILHLLDFEACEPRLKSLRRLAGYARLEQRGRQIRGAGLETLQLPDELAALARLCLELEPARRPSARAALAHRWLAA